MRVATTGRTAVPPVVTVAVAVVLAAACGPPPSVELTAGEAGATGEPSHAADRRASERAPLPELPPARERAPERFDEDGCVRRPPDEGGVDCGAEPPREAEPAGDGRAHRNLYGFRGPHYTEDVSRDAVVVLDGSVRMTADGGWEAHGLIRNETGEPVGDVTVTARLDDRDGERIGETTATVPVDPVRPGEPAPFVLRSAVEAADVASVGWDVEAGRPASGSPREVELTVHWQRRVDGEEDVALPGLHADGEGERPYLLYGSGRNDAGRAVARPRAVTAWLDGDGAVLHVAETPLVELGSGEPLEALPPDGLADFLHVVPAGDGTGLGRATPMFWVGGA